MADSARFQRAAKYLKDHWGLALYRASPTARGRWKGEWKTGYLVSGRHPGHKMGWYRYGTIKEIERVYKVPIRDESAQNLNVLA